MLVLVTYDVQTADTAGHRRLRRIAKTCQDFGQRVQWSVFECLVGDKELVRLRYRLLEEMDQEKDSIRLYFLDEPSRAKTEHYGTAKPRDLEDLLVI